jgi:hypothetical protein
MNHRIALLPLLILAACSSDSAARGATSDNGADTSTGSGADTGMGSGTEDSGVTDTGAEADATTDTESDAGGSADATTDTEPSTDTTADTDPAADTTADTGADTSTDNCPDELFIQSDPAPENSAYPDPMLRAYCDADYLNIESNGIIGYQFVPMTPNALRAQTNAWQVPLVPEFSDTLTTIPLLGVVAVAINGIPIYGANEAATPGNYGDPVYNAIVDFCNGHTGPQGDYHYHALVQECLAQAALEGVPSPIIGFALDGFPIYGPNGCLDAACTQVATFSSSWETTGDPTVLAWDNHTFTPNSDPTKLDQCNGRIGPDGSYAYYATANFPYTIGCYHGVPGPSVVTGGGGGGGGTGIPTACTAQADCEVAGACAGTLGCECTTTPMGQACIPTCNTAADCPVVTGRTFTCSAAGLCVPAR